MAQFTKKAIVETFWHLLNEKRLDRITVKDIVTDCGVSRKTFYYYFDDIYDLLSKCLENFRQESFSRINDIKSFEKELLKLAGFVTENQKAFYHIYNSVSRDELENYLYESTYPVISLMVKKRIEKAPELNDYSQTVCQLCTNAFTGSIMRWIKEGMSDDFEKKLKQTIYIFEYALNEKEK